jgi:hypothetical protein
MLALMDTRDEQKAWLAKVLASTGIAPTTLAQKSGLAPTTLTRFLNSEEHSSALSARTISSVEKYTGIRFGAEPPPPGMSESEAEPFDMGEGGDMASRLRALMSGNAVHPWRLKSRALETAGYHPGDVLLIDLNSEAIRGDVVCAQLYDFHRMEAATVFRLYEPPYLYAATFDRAQMAPILIDKTVGIKGPVVLSLRPRRHH